MMSGTTSNSSTPNPTGRVHQYLAHQPAFSSFSSSSALTAPLARPVLATVMSLNLVPVTLSSKSCSLPSKG